jgi:hypothetical protein
MWQLWKERAEFDVERQLLVPSTKPCQQVFVTCKYCGKSVSTETGAASGIEMMGFFITFVL